MALENEGRCEISHRIRTNYLPKFLTLIRINSPAKWRNRIINNNFYCEKTFVGERFALRSNYFCHLTQSGINHTHSTHPTSGNQFDGRFPLRIERSSIITGEIGKFAQSQSRHFHPKTCKRILNKQRRKTSPSNRNTHTHTRTHNENFALRKKCGQMCESYR